MKKNMRVILGAVTLFLLLFLVGCGQKKVAKDINKVGLTLTSSDVRADAFDVAKISGKVEGEGTLYVNGNQWKKQPKDGKFTISYEVSQSLFKEKVKIRYANDKKGVTKKVTITNNDYSGYDASADSASHTFGISSADSSSSSSDSASSFATTDSSSSSSESSSAVSTQTTEEKVNAAKDDINLT